MKKGELIIISGPSGCGKGTIVKKLLKDDKFAISISSTTRNPRNYEKEGEHYFFTTKEEFKSMIDRDEFLEYAEYCDNYYGTRKSYVDNLLEKGYNVILEIEIKGALLVKKKVEDAIFIFIVPPSIEELRKRLIGRGTEEIEVIEKRIKKSLSELKKIEYYDYVVINDVLEDAIKDINSIVYAEGLKTSKNKNIIDKYRKGV